MERDGLVLRLKPINDQRKLYISLTKEGQALYNRAQTQIEEAYRQIEAQFTAEKMQQLTHLLEEFIALGNSRQEDILAIMNNFLVSDNQRLVFPWMAGYTFS